MNDNDNQLERNNCFIFTIGKLKRRDKQFQICLAIEPGKITEGLRQFAGTVTTEKKERNTG